MMKKTKNIKYKSNKLRTADYITYIVVFALVVLSLSIVTIETKNILGSAIKVVNFIPTISDEQEFIPESCEDIEIQEFSINSTKKLGYLVEFKSPALLEIHNKHFKEIKRIDKSINEIYQIKSEAFISQAAVGIFGNSEIRNLGRIKKDLISNFERKFESQQDIIYQEHKSFQRNFNSRIRAIFTKTFNGVLINLEDSELDALTKLDIVKSIQPNFEVKTLLSDSKKIINADKVHKLRDNNNIFLTGEGIKIAVLDTGLDYTHPDFGFCTKEQIINNQCPRIINGIDFVNSIDTNLDGDLNDPEDVIDLDPMDDNGHGTHVTSIISSIGELGGIAPNATIIPYKVLDKFGSGSFADIILAIERAVDPNQDNDFSDHYDIISLSIGGIGNPDDAISTAIDRAVEAGVVAIVAAGNLGPSQNTILSPGVARKAITVGASTKCNDVATFSSRGPVKIDGRIQLKPEILAPGDRICAAQSSLDIRKNNEDGIDIQCHDNKHIRLSGTSMATPHVTGTVALMLQANPSLSPIQVKAGLMSSAKDLNLRLNNQGTGRINSLKAIAPRLLILPPAIEFSNLNLNQVLEIINPNPNPVEIRLEVGSIIKQGIKKTNIIKFNETNILLNGFKSKLVELEIDKSNLKGEVQGSAVITVDSINQQDSGNSQDQIIVPYSLLIPGPDLIGHFNLDPEPILIDDQYNFTAIINNIGSEKSGEFRVIISIEGDFEDNILENRILENRSFSSLEPGEFKFINFSHTFHSKGFKILKLIIESPKDIDKSNNVVREFRKVIGDGPDIKIFISSNKLAIDEKNKLNLFIDNDGSKVATNINVNINFKNTTIFSKNIGNLAAREFKEFEFNFTGTAKGIQEFIGIVTYSFNNSLFEVNKSQEVLVAFNGTDLATQFSIFDQFDLEVNKSTNLDILVHNLGLGTATNTVINIIDNGKLINSTTLNKLTAGNSFFQIFEYIPASIGKHNLHVDAQNEDELDPSDNSNTKEIEIGENIRSTFRIFDVEGNSINRIVGIGSKFFDFGSFFKLDLKKIPLPIEITTQIGNLDSRMQASFLYSDSEPKPDMDIVSTLIENVIDNKTFFHTIYANNVSWQFKNITFIYFNRLANTDNLSLQGCNNYNFNNNACDKWSKIEGRFSTHKDIINIIANINTDAVAITESDNDNDGLPDGSDPDDDNDNILDPDDNLNCIQGDFNSNVNIELKIKDNQGLSNGQGTQRLRFESKKLPVLIFEHNFTKSKFNCNKLQIKQDTKNNNSYILIHGLENITKSVFMPQTDALKKHICIKDTQVTDIDEVSEECNQDDEMILKCDNRVKNNISCIISNRLIKIEGIKNSAIIQFDPSEFQSNQVNTPNAILPRRRFDRSRNASNRTPDDSPIIFRRTGDDINFGRVLRAPKEVIIRLNDRIKFLYESRFYILNLRGITGEIIIFDITRFDNPIEIVTVELPIDGQEQLGLTPGKDDDILVHYKDIKNQDVTITLSQVVRDDPDSALRPTRESRTTFDDNINFGQRNKIQSLPSREKEKNPLDPNPPDPITIDNVNQSYKSGSGSKILGLIILVVLVTLILAASRLIKNRNTSQSHFDVLDLFVKDLIDQDLSPRMIAKALHTKGWQVRDILLSIRRCEKHAVYTRADKLISFIETSLATGKSKHQIAKALQQKGWSNKIIQKALRGEKILHKLLE